MYKVTYKIINDCKRAFDWVNHANDLARSLGGDVRLSSTNSKTFSARFSSPESIDIWLDEIGPVMNFDGLVELNLAEYELTH